MNETREFLKEQLIEQGVFKINERHLYECSLDEIMSAYHFYLDTSL
ncbi:Fur-regulated basic protein FbpA [Aneurinibacillus soli]|nr:Fur-regulated basic protein FbpA [Aneurinibacillus soli]